MEGEVYKKVCKLCGREYKTDKQKKRYCPECSEKALHGRKKRERNEYKKPEAEKKKSNIRKTVKKKCAGPDMRRCRGCFYGAILDGNYQICDYITITGHSRPCLPGADCTEFQPKESGIKKPRKQLTFSRTGETEFESYVQDSIFRTEKRRRR